MRIAETIVSRGQTRIPTALLREHPAPVTLGGAHESHLVRACVLHPQAAPAKAGQEARPMHTVIRTYSGQGAKELRSTGEA